MYTILRVKKICSETAVKIANMLNTAIQLSKYKADKYEYDSVTDTYSYSLSESHEWTEHQQEILGLLKILSCELINTQKGGVLIEVDTGVFLGQYQRYNELELFFSPGIVKELAICNIHYEISVYAATFKSDEERRFLQKK